MKKMFTLLVALAAFTTSFAQVDKDRKGFGNKDDRDMAYNDSRYKKTDKDWKGGYYYSRKEMEMDIAQINRKYDRKIESVKSNWFMTKFRKDRMIRDLQEQRKDEIREVFSKFNDKHNRFDEHGPKWNW